MQTTSQAPSPGPKSGNRAFGFTVAAILTLTPSLRSETVYFDDFEDGSVVNDLPIASNGSPIRWTERAAIGNYDMTNGDYRFVPSDETPEFIRADALDVALSDTSIRLQGRTTEIDGGLLVMGRNQLPMDTESYFLGIGHYPDFGGSIMFAGYLTEGVRRNYFGGTFPQLPFDVLDKDVILQLDIIGDEISAWVWQPGSPRPAEPIIQATNDRYQAAGHVALVSAPGGLNSTSVFRFIHVADAHIPDVVGDFDSTGIVSLDDLEVLDEQMGGEFNSFYDLTGDGLLNELDRFAWVHVVANTYFGDANFDGEFNSADLVELFGFGEYEDNTVGNSTWATGDWNGDNESTTADLVLAFQDGGYERGKRIAAHAVPEPSSGCLWLLAAAAWLQRRTGRKLRHACI